MEREGTAGMLKVHVRRQLLQGPYHAAALVMKRGFFLRGACAKLLAAHGNQAEGVLGGEACPLVAAVDCARESYLGAILAALRHLCCDLRTAAIAEEVQ